MLAMHLKQLFRKPIRTVLYILVLVLLTAFFCTSLNLYMDSQHNLQLANDTYTTIAIMELYADVDSYGNLVKDVATAKDYAGYHALTVYGYDLEPITTAPGVINYELRARYGAFSEDNVVLEYNHKKKRIPEFGRDVVRFKIVPEHQTQAEEDKDWSDIDFIDDGLYRISLSDYLDETGISICLRSYNLDVIESALDIFDYEKEPMDMHVDLGTIYTEWRNEPLTDTNSLMPSTEYADKPNCMALKPNTEYIAVLRNVSGSNSTFNPASELYYTETFLIARDCFLPMSHIDMEWVRANIQATMSTFMNSHSGYMNMMS